MKRHKHIPFLFLLLASAGCEYPFDPHLEKMNSCYGVEGKITSDSVFQEIRFFNTRSFTEKNEFEPITDASMTVEELYQNELLHTYPFAYQNSAGKYISLSPFKGYPGRIYRVVIKKGTDEITAADTMRLPVWMDSIRFISSEGYRIFPNGSYARVTRVSVACFFADPPEPNNAYLWDTFMNDSLLSDSLSKKSFGGDALFNGLYVKGLEVSSPSLFPEDSIGNTRFPPMTKITVAMAHISSDYLRYLVEVMLSTDWRFGPFSGPPANPKGNLYLNGKKENVYGYFHTESLTRLSIWHE